MFKVTRENLQFLSPSIPGYLTKIRLICCASSVIQRNSRHFAKILPHVQTITTVSTETNTALKMQINKYYLIVYTFIIMYISTPICITYIYIYICTYTYIYIYIYIYIYTYIHIHIYLYIYIYTHIHVYIHFYACKIFIFKCMHVKAYTKA